VARHYLDHASTSPPRPEVAAAVRDWYAGDAGTGDPGRIHHEGTAARVAVEQGREDVARFLGARSREVVFTSGATESIASAVFGAAERGDHLVVPAVEHSAVRLAAAALSEAGTHTVTEVPVDRLGHLDLDALTTSLRPGTALVCVQTGNHEVATRQDVAGVVARAHAAGTLVHVDAAASVGHDPLAFRDLDADLVSVAAHKFGGPPGIGALLVRRGLRLRPLLRGGDQERARRAGLENLPAIAGFAAACRALEERLDDEAAHQRRLTDRVLDAVAQPERSGLDGVVVLGDPVDRLPHLVCLGIDGIEPQAVLLGLDQIGIAAHSGSACATESLEPSPVLEAMGVDAHRSLRISVGWSSTDADIDALLDALPPILTRLRALRG
jgi:cysteine desulfurase